MASDEVLRRKQQQMDALLAAGAANGHSLMVLQIEDLANLLQRLQGGVANGTQALGNSLHAQTATIEALSKQIGQLLEEKQQLIARVAQLEQQNLGIRQFDAHVQLAAKKMDQQAKTSAEMMGLIKLGAAAFVGGGGLAGLLGGGAAACGAPAEPPQVFDSTAEPAPRQPTPQEQAVTQEQAASQERPAPQEQPLPQTLGEGAKAAVGRLSPATLDRVLACAERPHAGIPGGGPPLVAAVKVVLGCCDKETLALVQNDLGEALMQHLLALMVASQMAAAQAG